MSTVGCHLSPSKSYLPMGKETVKIGADTFQFFTRDPRGGKIEDLDVQDVESCLKFAREHGTEWILTHVPYALNACSVDEGLREFMKSTMEDDLRRLEYVPGSRYSFHSGSHVKQGMEVGITCTAQTFNKILKPEQITVAPLETMSEKDGEIGRNLEELREILDRVELDSHMDVYLDTCRVWDGGYDIVNYLDGIVTEFDRIIGPDRLKAIRLNDSVNPPGAYKGRRAVIGGGRIGEEALVRMISHLVSKHLPSYLGTPNDLDEYARGIALLRKLWYD